MIDETEWDEQFSRMQESLQAAAQQARKEMQAGDVKSLNCDWLKHHVRA